MPPDNEIISCQCKFLSRRIIILSRLPVKKVIATSGRDNVLKRHRDVNIITQPFNTFRRLICLDSYSRQVFIYLDPIWTPFDLYQSLNRLPI